jgi:hypothetical protein
VPNSILVIGDANAGYLPYVIEPEDADAWLNPDGETRMVEVLVAIANAGYTGIRFDVYGKTSDDRLLWTLHYNTASPEGRMAVGLYSFAKAGSKLLPVDEMLSILERIYREQELPLPKKQNPSAPTPGSI